MYFDCDKIWTVDNIIKIELNEIVNDVWSKVGHHTVIVQYS